MVARIINLISSICNIIGTNIKELFASHLKIAYISLAVIFAVLIMVSIINNNFFTSDDDSEAPDNETCIVFIYPNANDRNGEQQDDNKKEILSMEDRIISNYILRCAKEELSMAECRSLSDDQLYYIYNGILAYNGMSYPSNYFDRFEWYLCIYEQDEFDWMTLNEYQNRNLKKLRNIRVERNLLILDE